LTNTDAASHDHLDLDQLALPQAKTQRGLRSFLRAAAFVALFFIFLNTPLTATPLFVIGISIAVPVVLVWLGYIRPYRRSVLRLLSARDILHEALPDIPRPALTASRLFPFQIGAFLSLLVAAVSATLNQRWYIPYADWTAVMAALLAALLLLWMALGFLLDYGKLDRNGRAFIRGRIVDWTIAIGLFLLLVSILPAEVWRAADPLGRETISLVILYILGLLAFYGVLWANAMLPHQWALAPLARADYDAALRRVDLLLRLRPQNIQFKSLRGFILLTGARAREAEAVLRDLLANPQTHFQTLSAAACNTGYALMAQERFDEALPFLEAAIRMQPEYGTLYSAVASYYVRQKLNPERALEFMGRAIELTPRPKGRGLARYTWASLLGSQAVAAAMAGEDRIADESLNMAFADADKRFIPGVASLHYDAGRVAQMRGDLAGARSHFERAVALDPRGHGGWMAERALRELDGVETV